MRPDITMFVKCRNDVMEEKPIVCVTVQRGTARPYYLHGKEIRPEGVCVRQGASTVPAIDTARGGPAVFYCTYTIKVMLQRIILPSIIFLH